MRICGQGRKCSKETQQREGHEAKDWRRRRGDEMRGNERRMGDERGIKRAGIESV
jgi:hypothetical protein